MCIAATTAPTARRRTSLLYEQHKRKAKFRWNVVKLLFALLVVWYVKWTTKTVLEGTDGTYGEMDEDISAASSHRRKNHPVSLQKANEDYASNDDYSSSSSHDKIRRLQTTTARLANNNNNNNTEHKTNRKARAFQMHCLLCELFRDRYAARIINHARTERATMTKPCARARKYT